METRKQTFLGVVDRKKSLLMQAAEIISFFCGLMIVLASLGSENESIEIPLTVLGALLCISGIIFGRGTNIYGSEFISDLQGFLNHLSNRKIRLFLLLRSFSADEEKGHGMWGEWDDPAEEESIAEEFDRHGVTVALGKPGEKAPKSGALKYYPENDNWKTTISELVDRADLILFRCGSTSGVTWELSEVMRKDKLTQTIFITSTSNIDANLRIFESATSSVQLPKDPFFNDVMDALRNAHARGYLTDQQIAKAETDTKWIRTHGLDTDRRKMLSPGAAMVFVITEKGLKIFDADKFIECLWQAMRYIGFSEEEAPSFYESRWRIQDVINWIRVHIIVGVLLVLGFVGGIVLEVSGRVLDVFWLQEISEAFWFFCLKMTGVFLLSLFLGLGCCWLWGRMTSFIIRIKSVIKERSYQRKRVRRYLRK